MNDKIKQALKFVSDMVISENGITESNVFEFDLRKLLTDFGVKSQYIDFVSMCIYTSFEYY